MNNTDTSPSRQFLVQQAVLNAVEYWRPFYSRPWLKGWMAGGKTDYLPDRFHERVLAEYRTLAARYGATGRTSYEREVVSTVAKLFGGVR